MDFDQYFINENDYQFFKSLPADEKLLFLYDLLVTDWADASFTITDPDTIEGFLDDSIESKPVSLDEMTDILSNELHDMVANVIAEDNTRTNVIFINQFLVVNSESEKDLSEAVVDIAMDGLVLSEKQLTLKQLSIFHQQRYCKVYTIVGKIPKLYLN